MGIIKLFILFTIPILISVLIFDAAPLVNLEHDLKQEDVGRIKKIIKKNDPRLLKDGQIKKITIKEEELNLALDYAFASLSSRMAARVNLKLNPALVQGTIRVPWNPLGGFLNMEAGISFNDGKMVINRMTLGKLPIPVLLMNPAMALGYNFFKSTPWFTAFTDILNSIKTVQLADNQIFVEFQWDKGVAIRFQNQTRNLMLSKADRQRIGFYFNEIIHFSNSVKDPKVSLSDYLQPLFSAALERSRTGEPPVPENRALVFSMTLYAMNWSPEILTGDPDSKPSSRIPRKTLTLRGRSDLAKHFLISAAITAGSNSGVSSIVGVFKEMEDSREGSGFSFADLAADRAGISFAKLAVDQNNLAQLLQSSMAQIRHESEFMPSIDHLPEGIMELEFKRTFHDLNSREYALVEQEIEYRISSCKIYRQVKTL